jgi:hypothetical protein
MSEGQERFVLVQSYDTKRFPFIKQVTKLFEHPLFSLHLSDGVPTEKLRPVQDQATRFHSSFYAAFATNLYDLKTTYLDFIEEVARPLAREQGMGAVLYQTVPTFRVQFPGNLAVGEFHKDGDYGHPEGEMALWVPLTVAAGTSAVQFQTQDGAPLVSADVVPGEFWFGNTRDVLHGNLPNDTGLTRVSFDFRVLPLEKYDPANAKRSVAAKKKFVIGDYWSYGTKERM